MKYLILFAFLGFFLSANSQSKNELTLEDAVMQQWRKFRPNFTNQFQWLPNGNDYVFVSSNYQTLYRSDVSAIDVTISPGLGGSYSLNLPIKLAMSFINVPSPVPI